MGVAPIDQGHYIDVPHQNLQAAAQVTDAWLAELARRRQGGLATMNSSLSILHPDVTILLPL